MVNLRPRIEINVYKLVHSAKNLLLSNFNLTIRYQSSCRDKLYIKYPKSKTELKQNRKIFYRGISKDPNLSPLLKVVFPN